MNNDFDEKEIELKKELALKECVVLNTKSDEELAEMLFAKVKQQKDLSSINLGLYWNELGVKESIFSYPQSTVNRWEQINNMVWKKVQALKKERKQAEIEQEREEAMKKISTILEWIKEKGLKRLTKDNLSLFLDLLSKVLSIGTPEILSSLYLKK